MFGTKLELIQKKNTQQYKQGKRYKQPYHQITMIVSISLLMVCTMNNLIHIFLVLASASLV